MADWGTTATTSSHDTSAAISERITGRDRQFETVGGLDELSQSFSQYSVVGIDANKIDGMREAIRTYVNNIMTYVEGIDPNADQSNAFQGKEAQDAVRDYVNKIKEYCTNLTSALLSFSDKLGDVKKTWDDAQKDISSHVDTDSGAFSAGTKYTETIQ